MKRLLFLSLFLLPVALSAQTPFRYSAKFVCGKPTAVEIGSLAVAPGTYFTAINVHNLSFNQNVTIRKRFSFGKISEQPGGLSQWFSVTLLPGQTMLIDCRDILSRVGGPPFAEGVAELISTLDIDVIGVYTTVGAGNLVTTMEIDRAPRR